MTRPFLDKATSVRGGEELPHEPLENYLQRTFSQPNAKLETAQFPSGFSNLTYLLRFGGKELVLRRPPFGANIKTAHDMHREYRVLVHLTDVSAKVPRPLAYCGDAAVIGAPFYIMERISGIILRTQVPKGMVLDAGAMARLSRAFIENLAALHRIDYRAAGLGDLGKSQGYVARQVEGWIKRYTHAKTDDLKDMTTVAQWLRANLPAESGAALIHNDYKYDNLVLDPHDLGQIRALLDWEMATIGDPLMDLGTSLAYWVEAGDPKPPYPLGLTALPGNLNRSELVSHYIAAGGTSPKNPVFYYAYGLFKLAVILQQIYARHKRGFSSDPRFASLIHLVVDRAARAAEAINHGHL